MQQEDGKYQQTASPAVGPIQAAAATLPMLMQSLLNPQKTNSAVKVIAHAIAAAGDAAEAAADGPGRWPDHQIARASFLSNRSRY